MILFVGLLLVKTDKLKLRKPANALDRYRVENSGVLEVSSTRRLWMNAKPVSKLETLDAPWKGAGYSAAIRMQIPMKPPLCSEMIAPPDSGMISPP